MKAERRRVATLVVLTTIALIVLLGVRPVSTDLILAAYVLTLASIALAATTRILAADSWRDRESQFDHALRRRPAHQGRPPELMRIEREITLGMSSAGHLHMRLLPVLRDAAAARLGFELELQPARAEAALGEEAWELVRPDRPAPASHNAPGIPLRRVAAVVDTLERL